MTNVAVAISEKAKLLELIDGLRVVVDCITPEIEHMCGLDKAIEMIRATGMAIAIGPLMATAAYIDKEAGTNHTDTFMDAIEKDLAAQVEKLNKFN
jgi:hypothetical protein